MNSAGPIEETMQYESEMHPTAVASPRVQVDGTEYLVDLSAQAHPRFHRVRKDKTCSCGDPACPAIDAVRHYLLAGGVRAPDPPGLVRCPICGNTTTPDPDWNGKFTHEPGWRCDTGGLMHFLLAKANRIKLAVAANPYLIPPAPGYPGLLRADLVTSQETGFTRGPDYSI
jgi:hypothetical protein